jgi:hypothetical protein
MPPAADEKEDGTPDYWFSVTPPKAVPEPEENEVKPEEVPAPEPALEEEPAKPDFGLPFIHPRPNTPAPTMLLVSDEHSAVPSAAAAAAAGENTTTRALLTGSYDIGDDYETSSGDYSGGVCGSKGKVCICSVLFGNNCSV